MGSSMNEIKQAYGSTENYNRERDNYSAQLRITIKKGNNNVDMRITHTYNLREG